MSEVKSTAEVPGIPDSTKKLEFELQIQKKLPTSESECLQLAKTLSRIRVIAACHSEIDPRPAKLCTPDKAQRYTDEDWRMEAQVLNIDLSAFNDAGQHVCIILATKKDDQKVIGFAHLVSLKPHQANLLADVYKCTGKTGELFQLFVLPEYQSQSVGTALAKKAFAFAQQNLFNTVLIRSFFKGKNSDRLRKFYQAIGAKYLGEIAPIDGDVSYDMFARNVE